MLTVGTYLTSFDASCASAFTIKDSGGATISSWATLDGSGNLSVDRGTVDSKSIKIVLTYNGA